PIRACSARWKSPSWSATRRGFGRSAGRRSAPCATRSSMCSPSAVYRSAAEAEAHWHWPEPVSQVPPSTQSAFAKHCTQAWLVVLQSGVLVALLQSRLRLHCTHVWFCVLQMRRGSVSQSSLPVHWTHTPLLHAGFA